MANTTARRRGVKAATRALLLAVCASTVFVSAGAAPALADTCGNIVRAGDYYTSAYRAAGIQIIEPPNDAGFGSHRAYQKRWRDHKDYRNCYYVGGDYHRHYRHYGEDTRSRVCVTWNYWPIGCGAWGAPAWREVSPGLIYLYSHST